MPRYRIPCWIDVQHNFDVEIEADSPTNALLELHRLAESTDLVEMDYIEWCIDNGFSDPQGAPIDWTDDPSMVEEVIEYDTSSNEPGITYPDS